MPDVVAKTMAFICGALLVATCAVLYVTSRPQAGANEVVAEFQDAFPILEGMYVRVDGAIAGSVGPVEVTDDGLAEVTLILDETIEDPSSDATAAIRQQDTTGDSYVAFEPGDSGKALPEVDGTPTIECGAETSAEPLSGHAHGPALRRSPERLRPGRAHRREADPARALARTRRARRRRERRRARAPPGDGRGEPGARRGEQPERCASRGDRGRGGRDGPGGREARGAGRPDRLARDDAHRDGRGVGQPRRGARAPARDDGPGALDDELPRQRRRGRRASGPGSRGERSRARLRDRRGARASSTTPRSRSITPSPRSTSRAACSRRASRRSRPIRPVSSPARSTSRPPSPTS